MKYSFRTIAAGVMLAAMICCIAPSMTSCKNANATSSEKAQAVAVRTSSDSLDTPQAAQDGSIPQGARILMEVYPTFVKGYKDGRLLMSDGSTIVYDDGRKKSFVELLDDADPEDMFAFKYDLDSWTPGKMQDAGRSRCEELFKKMYGNSAKAVSSKLVAVRWPFGAATNKGGVNKNIKTVKFTSVNGANKQLEKVVAELEKHPELHKYLAQSGAFYWRPVRGAKRQSAHSYGMTIDIGVKYSDYWRNQSTNENNYYFQMTPSPAMLKLSAAQTYCIENNTGAKRLYHKLGFRETGRIHAIADGLDEIELSCCRDRGR